MSEARDTLPPPSETSRVLLVLDGIKEQLSESARTQRLQGQDLDLVMHALQSILLELQLPDAAARIQRAINRRHPPHSHEDAMALTPPNGRTFG